mmetsp:Transcript_108507/g.305835  ORF Transcript_108507/g.305835 Transcript_108507/m.305835 type:complete len:229 (+) Transcript_108507:245-931(+)
MRVHENRLPREATREEAYRVEHEARADLCEDLLLWIVAVLRRLWRNLIMAEPNLLVQIIEGHDVVVEGLALGMVPWRSEGLYHQRFHEFQLGELIEVLVELQNGPGSKQAVARKFHLGSRVDVQNLKFQRRSRRHPRHPHVEVLTLAGLEENHVVATFQLAHLVNFGEFGTLLKFLLRLMVRQHLLDVLRQMPEPRGDAPAAKDERALLVFPTRVLLNVLRVGHEVRV